MVPRIWWEERRVWEMWFSCWQDLRLLTCLDMWCEPDPSDRMLTGSSGREGRGVGRVGLLILSVTVLTVSTVAANSPPRFLLETNVGSEIVLRLREGPQQNNSILRSVSLSCQYPGKICVPKYFLNSSYSHLSLTTFYWVTTFWVNVTLPSHLIREILFDEDVDEKLWVQTQCQWLHVVL